MDISKKVNNIMKQIFLIFLYIFLILFLEVIFFQFITSKNLLLANLSYILIELIVLTVYILIFRKTLIPNFSDFKKNWRSYLKKYYIYWLVGLAIMLISNLIISNFIGMPVNEEANRLLIKKYPAYALFSTLICAPITEELMIRVPLKNTFKNPWIYIILSGLLFGSLHVINVIESGDLLELLYIIPYGALGSSFAKMYYDSDNVWINISFHFIHNLIAVSMIFLGGA